MGWLDTLWDWGDDIGIGTGLRIASTVISARGRAQQASETAESAAYHRRMDLLDMGKDLLQYRQEMEFRGRERESYMAASQLSVDRGVLLDATADFTRSSARGRADDRVAMARAQAKMRNAQISYQKRQHESRVQHARGDWRDARAMHAQRRQSAVVERRALSMERSELGKMDESRMRNVEVRSRELGLERGLAESKYETRAMLTEMSFLEGRGQIVTDEASRGVSGSWSGGRTAQLQRRAQAELGLAGMEFQADVARIDSASAELAVEMTDVKAGQSVRGARIDLALERVGEKLLSSDLAVRAANRGMRLAEVEKDAAFRMLDAQRGQVALGVGQAEREGQRIVDAANLAADGQELEAEGARKTARDQVDAADAASAAQDLARVGAAVTLVGMTTAPPIPDYEGAADDEILGSFIGLAAEAWD